MISKVKEEIRPLQDALLTHPLYNHINTPEDLKCFMEHHVYAVWDFMSLLKALQNGLTCTKLPWIPVGNPETRYLINEIVLAEETDINMFGERQSHYEMYIDAMKRAGANTEIISSFITTEFSQILESANSLPASIAQFLRFTFETISRGKLHEIAAAFTFGREDVIPSMFNAIISRVQEHFPESELALFNYYFDRHIELDEDEHGPMALEMVKQLCEDDTTKWNEVLKISKEALSIRIGLWDGILEEITSSALVK